MHIAHGFPGSVGNTPLIEIESLSRETGCRILGKAEHLNPGGSIKDRAGKFGDHAVRPFDDFPDGHLEVFLRRWLFAERLRFRNQSAHFKNRDHGQKADEEEQQEEEESDRADEHRPVPL